MKKCLIVDDKEQNRYLLDVLLRRYGYETTTAENGADALDKARVNPPDIVITDVLMPVMDGFALCKAWKSDEKLRNIPLVIYTATYIEPKDEAFALSLGADRFIIKPQDQNVLLEELKKILEKTADGSFVGAGQTLDENDFFRRHYEAVIMKLDDKMAELQRLNARLTREIEEKEKALAFFEKEKHTLKQTEETLLSEMRLSDYIINSLPGIFYLFDDQGCFKRWNKNFENVSGYSTEEISRMHPLNLFTGEDRQAVEQAIQNVFTKGADTVEAEFLSKDSRRTPYLFTGVRISIGNTKNLIGMGIDITDRIQAEEKIKEQLDELLRWHDATLGRENRILNLKREVNELLSKAGQPPRYPSTETK
jgi:hypothetical protein